MRDSAGTEVFLPSSMVELKKERALWREAEAMGRNPGDRMMEGRHTGPVSNPEAPSDHSRPSLEETLATLQDTLDKILERLPPVAPEVDESSLPFDSRSGMEAHYGMMGRKTKLLVLPYPMKLSWETDTALPSFYCHELIHDQLKNIFQETLDHYGLEEIQRLRLDLFGGCSNIRKMRGSDDRYSTHSWAAAVDIDPDHNRLRWTSARATLARPEYNAFWDIVERNGGVSSGRSRGFDWMHFQFAQFSKA